MGDPMQTNAWKSLQSLDGHQDGKSSIEVIRDPSLSLSIDFTNSFISPNAWNHLIALAREQKCEEWRSRMFKGEVINVTEDRAAWHVALRSGDHDDVLNELSRMRDFVEKTHQSNRFDAVVHIGIGGSDLGPRLICQALSHLPKKIETYFVANVDAADIEETLKPLNPERTLFIIASKTFTTQETMMNAAYAKKWLGDLPIADHMIALSMNKEAVTKFGINPDNMFPFWDWVGGRFSVWSSIGMPIALTYGYEVFQEFLDGAKAMDIHFKSTSVDKNLPILLALYGIWNRNFLNRPALAILPYVQNLALLPNFLQQLDMESNGKSVNRDGDFIRNYKTGPIIFGQAGTNGQHAFHQWLHQGSDIIPSEIIIAKTGPYNEYHQKVLNANARAQAMAFAKGDQNTDDNHRFYAGGRPSVMIMVDQVTPYSLGELIALYEHKVFIQGIIWNINSFDQFGVELGKKMANTLLMN